MNLQKLAEKINERWGITVYATPDTMRVGDDGQPMHYLPKCTDSYNSDWIIWCLDRLEELYPESIELSSDPKGKSVTYCDMALGRTFTFKEATRAEAVTLALAKALGVEE
jgi:hypothetical protein